MNHLKYKYFADCHHEIMEDFIMDFFKNEDQILKGKYSAFDSCYKPIFEKSGVNLVNMVIGNEHTVHLMYSNTDRYFLWDTIKKMDLLTTELEMGCQTFDIVKSADDFDRIKKDGKIAILLTLNGGMALQGKQVYSTLTSLRALYRMGLRGVQLTVNNRNRLADGVAQSMTGGKITGFGREVVKECNRLGIVMDTAQLSDSGFYDMITLTDNPVIDSHSCANTVNDFPRNISDHRIKAIADKGGIVGLSFWNALVDKEKEQSTFDDLCRHIDHIIEIAGEDTVALGPDFCSFQTPKRRDVLKGYAMLNPSFSEMDYQTPAQSEKYPGVVDNIWYGIRKNDFIDNPSNHFEYGNIIDLLERKGYKAAQIEKILGENLIRVYKEVLK